MISRLNEGQCLEISKWCINSILEHSIHEKGLFRLSPSMNDIRRVKQQLSEGRGRRQINDHDPHIIAGVLLSCLKEMQVPLLHEMKDDISDIDINDDSDENIHGVARSIAKLPAPKIETLKLLLELLYKLATTYDNDSNIAQLVMAIAPVIYKPLDTSYMSIRHTELLKHIRPVLQFMTEHHQEILRVVGPSKYQGTNTSTDNIPNNITERLQQLQNISISNSTSTSANIPSIPSPVSPFSNKISSPSYNSTLSIHIHSTMEIEGVESAHPDDLISLSTHIASHPPNYHSQEWKILESLVYSRLELWLKQGPGLWESDTTLQTRSSQGNLRRSTDDLRFYDSDEDDTAVKDNLRNRWELTQSKKVRNHDSTSNKNESRRGEERRKLVAECKHLRQEIQNYEERMKHENKKVISDKGDMHSTYVRYKELKRIIRDRASTDIQRVYRGHQVRKRAEVAKFRSQRFMNQSSSKNYEQKKSSNSSNSQNPAYKVNLMMPSPLNNVADQKSLSWFGDNKNETSESTQLVLNQLHTRYKECLEQKKQLKKNLKKFDDDFLGKKGRLPRKADKEVMRPQYQKYHEVRAEIDKLKAEITSLLGHFPSELEENRIGSTSTHNGNWNDHQSTPQNESSDHEIADSMSEDDYSHNTTDNSVLLSSSDDATIRVNPIKNGTPVTAPPKGVDSLVIEKKQLHAYLKAFEKEFNRVNGRHVMHPEDIKPVAEEYQRYKELKKILKDLRSTL